MKALRIKPIFIAFTIVFFLIIGFASVTVKASDTTGEQIVEASNVVQNGDNVQEEPNIGFMFMGSFMVLTLVAVIIWVFITDGYSDKENYKNNLSFLEELKTDNEFRDIIDTKLCEISFDNNSRGFASTDFESACSKNISSK